MPGDFSTTFLLRKLYASLSHSGFPARIHIDGKWIAPHPRQDTGKSGYFYHEQFPQDPL